MRLNNPISSILNSQAKVDCLRFLCRYPSEINGTQLAKMIGLTPATSHKALKELFNEHVVTLKGVGNNHLYELNRKNYIVQDMLVPLFESEGKVFDFLIQEIKKLVNTSKLKDHILSVALFGSVHERTDKASSDVDLFILIKNKSMEEKVFQLFLDVNKSLLNKMELTLEPYIKTVDEFKKKRELNVIQSMIKSNTLILGKSPEAFL